MTDDLQPNTDPVTPPPANDLPKTFTQDELNGILNKSKQTERAAAQQAILKDLGIEDVEAAKAAIAEAQQVRDAQLTESQRATQAAEAARKAADDEKAQAAADRQAIKIERELVKAGVNPERIERASRMVSVSSEASDEEIATEVKALLEEMPELSNAKPAGTPDSHVPGRTTRTTQSSSSPGGLAAGADRASKFNSPLHGIRTTTS